MSFDNIGDVHCACAIVHHQTVTKQAKRWQSTVEDDSIHVFRHMTPNDRLMRCSDASLI